MPTRSTAPGLRIGLRVTLLIATVALAACFDRVTAPPPTVAPAPRQGFLGDANWGLNNSTTFGAWDGSPIDSIYGGFPHPAQPLGPFPYPTFIRVRVSGTVSQVPRALRGDNIVRNAYAVPGDAYFWGAVGFTSNGGVWYATTSETLLRVVAPISPFRNRAGGQPDGDASHCGSPGYALCWSWAGTAHLEFERYPVDLTLTQSPDTVLWAGQTMTFTAGMSPASVPSDPSHPIVMAELKWRWVPDDSVSSDTLGCGTASGQGCSRVMRRSGTMYAAAYVNGQQQQKSVHVVVKVPTLHLSASKTVLAAPGENDTFTATANGPLTVLGWSFNTGEATMERMQASSGSLGVRSGRVRPGTGSVTAPHGAATKVLAVPASSHRLAGVGSSWDTCSSGLTECTNYVIETGTVDVLATVNGDTLRASASVQVVPCPLPGDSILNFKVVRDGIGFLMDKSVPADPTQRRENGTLIYRDTLTGEISLNFYVSDSIPTGCSWVAKYVPGPPNTVVVGHVHYHPFAAGDTVPPHVCRKAARGGIGASGPSPDDSIAAVNSGVPQYIADRDSIYLIDASGHRSSWSRTQPGCADIIPPKPAPNSMPFDRPLMYDRSPRFAHGSRR